jgi:hypothetical protein
MLLSLFSWPTIFKSNRPFKRPLLKRIFSFYLVTAEAFVSKGQQSKKNCIFKAMSNFHSKIFHVNYPKNIIGTLYATVFLIQNTKDDNSHYHQFDNPFRNPFFKPTRRYPKFWTGEEDIPADIRLHYTESPFGPKVPDAPLEVLTKKLIEFYNLWPFEQWAWSLVSLIVLYWITGHFYGIWLHDTLRRWSNRWIYISLYMRTSLILVDLAINLSLGLHYMQHRDTIMGQIMIKCPIAVSPVIFALELLYVTLYFFYYKWVIIHPRWLDFWLHVNKKPYVIKIKRGIQWLILWGPIVLFVLLWFVPATYLACSPGWKSGFLWFFFILLLSLLTALG